MVCLFDFAKAVDGLVIGTENKSEHLLGYFTRFGDQASDLEPITHLFKTQIYQLAKYLKIPDPIITKPPTANLWANQTDEQELGFSYSQADPILSLYHDQHQTREQIISAGFNLELVDKVVRQSESSAFKLLVPYHL
jgi:NAD+ synthase